MTSSRAIGPADAYIRFYETLSPATLPDLARVATVDVHFRDPFNDLRGVDEYQRVLGELLESVPDVKFTVGHQAVDDDTCFIRWRMIGTLRGAPWIVEGMSALRFAADGRVREHVDYWDAAAQFYERLPLIGGVLRFIRRRVGSSDAPRGP